MDNELRELIKNGATEEQLADYMSRYEAAHGGEAFSVHELKECDILKVLNGTYIAKRFFGKSSSWFSQKLNHNIKNGRPCDFTPEEWAKLKEALSTVGFEIQMLAASMKRKG